VNEPPNRSYQLALAVIVDGAYDTLASLISSTTTQASIDEVFTVVLSNNEIGRSTHPELPTTVARTISAALTPSLEPDQDPDTLTITVVSMEHCDVRAIAHTLMTHLKKNDDTWTISLVDDPISHMVAAELASLLEHRSGIAPAILTQVTEYRTTQSSRVRVLRGAHSYTWDQDRCAILLWQLPIGRHRSLVSRSSQTTTLHEIEPDTDPSHSLQISKQIDVDATTLHNASIVVALGAGASSAQAVSAAQALAKRLGGVLGATRVLTDRGVLPHDLQIGTTGVTIAPTTYLSFGVSGALQHLQGIVMPEQSITVNLDAHAPMVQSSTLAYVCDAETVLTNLLDALPVLHDDDGHAR
jgi:electron transfer flavoprotein alpha subunit